MSVSKRRNERKEERPRVKEELDGLDLETESVTYAPKGLYFEQG